MRTGCLLCLALIVSAGTGIAAADPAKPGLAKYATSERKAATGSTAGGGTVK